MPDDATVNVRHIVDDLNADVARLRDAGARFRNDIIEGPGGKQILLQDPSGNVRRRAWGGCHRRGGRIVLPS